MEAFSNEVIPDDFVYNFEEQTKKDVQIAHQYSKEQIERKLSISEKLANVLPIIFKIPSPKGTKIWEDFVELRRLRDRIIHMKGKDRKYSKADHMYPQSIWKELLKPYHLNYPLVSKNLILYFKEKNDHWLKYCPF